MKLFAASAELAELERCAAEGLCEGVVVLGTEGAASSWQDVRTRLGALGRACAGPILVEVALVELGSDEAPEVIARGFASLGSQFAARVPFAAGGRAILEACRHAGVMTNAFACATPDEAAAAGRAGATWVSPTLTGTASGAPSGVDLDALRKTRGLLKTYQLGTELLVGPLRDAGALLDATIMGAQVTLARPEILRDLAARQAQG